MYVGNIKRNKRDTGTKFLSPCPMNGAYSMQHLKQFFLILLISFLGELFNYFIPLPIPASIYGLLIMLFVLKFKILGLDQVQDTAEFLIGIMTLLFVPAAVGLIGSWGIVKEILLPLAIITVATTFLVIIVTGRVTQLVIRFEKRAEK